MANIWWRNLAADNDANNINNYATTEGGSTVPGGTLADHVVFFSNTASSEFWQLSANLTIQGFYTLAADTGGTDNYTGNGTTTGELKLNGFTLTCISWTFGGTDASNKCYLNLVILGSKLSYSGDGEVKTQGIIEGSGTANSTIETTGTIAKLTITTSGENNYSGAFTLYNTGKLKMSVTDYRNRISKYLDYDGTCELNFGTGLQLFTGTMDWRGKINLGSSTKTISSTIYVIASTADITGTGGLRYVGVEVTSYTSAKTGYFTLSGYLDQYFTTASRSIMPGQFGNADVKITSIVAGAGAMYGNTIKLTCKDFYFDGNTEDFTLDFSTKYSEIEVLGNLNFVNTSGAGVFTYIKGGELWTLAGASKTCDFNGKEINDITIASGASYTDGGGFACTDLVNSGSFTLDPTKTYSCVNPSGSGEYHSTGDTVYVQYTGDYDFTGTLDNVVFVKSNAQPINGANKKLGIMIAI